MKIPMLVVLACIAGYLCLKFMTRRVWYRQEHLRPGYLRHISIIHTVDLFANLFLCATFFLMLNTGQWMRTALITGVLIGYDFALRQCFLYLEARRIRAHSPEWSLRSAKRRVRDRVKRETTD